MANTKVQEAINRSRNNPLSLVDSVIDAISATGALKAEIVDASNPFTQLLEVSACCLQTSVDEHNSIVRSLYPRLSETRQDIYRHLSDRDKVGVYALPSRTVLTFAVSVEEVISRAVNIPGTSVSKLTIPTQSRFRVNGVEFGIHYPIDIRVLNKGGIRAVWNNDLNDSPVTLTENILDTARRTLNGQDGAVEYLLIDIPVEQFSLETRTGAIQASGFKQTYAFSDEFYFARVYMASGEVWEEIDTSFSNTVYDVSKVTAVLEVQDGRLAVSIPQVYFSHGIVGNNIRVDIYTTRGEMSLALGGLQADAFELEWRDFDNIEDGVYTSPLYEITAMALRGAETTSGGRSAVSTDELRKRAVNGSKGGETPFDLTTEVEDMGYDISRLYDRATSRVYSLSRHLAEVESVHFSNVGVLAETLEFKFEDLINGLNGDVNVHLNSLTLLPTTLYQSTASGLKVITADELTNPDAYLVDEVIAKLNELKPVYSPYHYVFENRNEYFNKRCYLLDQPKLTGRSFEDANGSYPYDISLDMAQVKYMTNGYRIIIKIKSGDNIKILPDENVGLQLGFTPINSSRRVYINGEQSPSFVEDERVYVFDFETRFDLNEDDQLAVEGFRNSETDSATYLMALTQKFDVFFTVNGVPTVGETSELDDLIGHELLPEDAVALSHETITVNLGTRLKPLEGRTLTYFTEAKYEEWEEDVILTHTRPKLKDDSSGYIDVSIVDGKVVYVQEAEIGDPVLDANGNPRIKHAKGSLKLDENGEAVLIEEGYVSRKADILTFNAMFRYATEASAQQAITDKTAEIRGYVENDLSIIDGIIPPRTELSFTPKSNIGSVTITETGEAKYTVSAGLSFTVNLFMTENAYKDVDSHERYKETVREVIIERVKDKVVSVLAIEAAIRDALDGEVVTVDVGTITDENLQVASVIDSDRSFSVAPIMTMLSDGRITPKDDINVNIANVVDNSTV